MADKRASYAASISFLPDAVTNDLTRPIVVFVPDWTQGNPYLSRLRQSLEESGVSIVLKDYPAGLLPLNKLKTSIPDASVIHIHWLSELIAPLFWPQSAIRLHARLLLLLVDLALVRARGTRVVWTVHNLFEHESKNPDTERRVRQLLARCCDHVIVHSKSAKEVVQASYGVNISEKISVIRHGNYDGAYVSRPARVVELSRKFGLSGGERTVLFFGSIRHYKGVERLIEAFQKTTKSNLRLLVVGRPFSIDIEQSIGDLCKKDKRIVTELAFIPEDDVAAYFSIADVVVIPFERTLSSGSAVLAMTLGKALIIPTHAKVLDLVDETGAIYFDSDVSLIDHLQNLDKFELRTMGQHNRQIAETFSLSIVGRATLECYSLPPGAEKQLAKEDRGQL